MSKSHPSNLLNSQDEEEEEETDGLVNQVLDEIGIEMQMVSEAKTNATRNTSKSQ